jgi:apolipoprotein N-acyltransferase
LFIGLSALFSLSFFCKTSKQAFATHYMFGFGYFLFGLCWIGNALLVEGSAYKWAYPLAVLGLPLGMSIFYGLAGYIHHRFFAGARSVASYIGFAIIYSLMEWLRGHIFTGFPWILFGYGWNGSLCMMQILSIIGVYGLTALTMFWCAAPAYCLLTTDKMRSKIIVGLCVFFTLFATFTYGTKRLIHTPAEHRDDVIIRVIQPNIAQKHKWDNDKLLGNFYKSLSLTTPEKDPNTARTHYIIWPETSVLQSILDSPKEAQALKAALQPYGDNTFLLTGIVHSEYDDNKKIAVHNSLTVFDKNLNAVSRYDKSHLVPFGEYMPFQKIIPFGPVATYKGFTKGQGPQRLRIPPLQDNISFSAMICYEIIFPGRVIDNTEDRPSFIVNITNDGWYGKSHGPLQHFVKARFRAIEEGIPVIRSANTGISGIIDPLGRIKTQSKLNTDVALTEMLPQTTQNKTIYTKYRDIPFWCLVLIAVLFCGASTIWQRFQKP